MCTKVINISFIILRQRRSHKGGTCAGGHADLVAVLYHNFAKNCRRLIRANRWPKIYRTTEGVKGFLKQLGTDPKWLWTTKLRTSSLNNKSVVLESNRVEAKQRHHVT